MPERTLKKMFCCQRPHILAVNPLWSVKEMRHVLSYGRFWGQLSGDMKQVPEHVQTKGSLHTGGLYQCKALWDAVRWFNCNFECCDMWTSYCVSAVLQKLFMNELPAWMQGKLRLQQKKCKVYKLILVWDTAE